MSSSRYEFTADQIQRVIDYLKAHQKNDASYYIDTGRSGRLFFAREIAMNDSIQSEIERVFSDSKLLSVFDGIPVSDKLERERYVPLGITIRDNLFDSIARSAAWNDWLRSFSPQDQAAIHELVKSAVAYKLLNVWCDNQKKYTLPEIMPVVKCLTKVFAQPKAEQEALMTEFYQTLQFKLENPQEREKRAMKILSFLDEYVPVTDLHRAADSAMTIALTKAAFEMAGDSGKLTYPVLHKQLEKWLAGAKEAIVARTLSQEKAEKSKAKASRFFGESPVQSDEAADITPKKKGSSQNKK